MEPEVGKVAKYFIVSFTFVFYINLEKLQDLKQFYLKMAQTSILASYFLFLFLDT